MIKIYNSPCSLPPPFPNHFQTPLFFPTTPKHPFRSSSSQVFTWLPCHQSQLPHWRPPSYPSASLGLSDDPDGNDMQVDWPPSSTMPSETNSAAVSESDLPFPSSIKARKQTGLLDFFSRMPAKEVHEKWRKRKRENEDRDREEHAKLKQKEEAEKLQKLEKRRANNRLSQARRRERLTRERTRIVCWVTRGQITL